MKPFVTAIFAVMMLTLVRGQDQALPSKCTLQEQHCNKNCVDGGGDESSCKKHCEMDREACTCMDEQKCTTDECLNGCYDKIKADYDCSVGYQTCTGFCKNQYVGDDNCLESYCKSLNEKCECIKAGTCKAQNSTGPLPGPSCKFLHKKCLRNCREGEGEESACSTFCRIDSEICACIRKHDCSSMTSNAGNFQKCIGQCQALHKDDFDCDVFRNTCLGNCKTSFAADANCPTFCSKVVEDCKCGKTGNCGP